jgi:hypothetical protein
MVSEDFTGFQGQIVVHSGLGILRGYPRVGTSAPRFSEMLPIRLTPLSPEK